MRMHMMVLAAALMAPAGGAHGAWTVNAEGACVDQWTARDVLRGPTAIVNAPLLPFRQIAGGAEYAWNREGWTPWNKATLGTAATGVSGAAGMVEGIWWIATGVTDTVTGGVFHLAPEEATELSVAPDLSTAIAKPAPPTMDQCGRPLK
ncbi:MAG: hypothetical protein ACRERC_13995 [Candidatus Binatia bacterium]